MTEPLSPVELHNGKLAFDILLKKLGQEVLRKLQRLINDGAPNAILLGRFPVSVPQKSIAVLELCLEYMREKKPIRPWPMPGDRDLN